MGGDIVPISSKQEESQRRCPGNKSIFTGLPTQSSKEVILILLRAPLSPAPPNHGPLESFSFPPPIFHAPGFKHLTMMMTMIVMKMMITNDFTFFLMVRERERERERKIPHCPVCAQFSLDDTDADQPHSLTMPYRDY